MTPDDTTPDATTTGRTDLTRRRVVGAGATLAAVGLAGCAGGEADTPSPTDEPVDTPTDAPTEEPTDTPVPTNPDVPTSTTRSRSNTWRTRSTARASTRSPTTN
ncbi:hypothetical protein [Halorarum halobium]|uniref:hypothetical protein n=1 Tax=Halorarum halobium TaxID=3075121 RepID=UPI0028A86DF1|nr:hypothetical protein [Halobaculum sp. XH14]